MLVLKMCIRYLYTRHCAKCLMWMFSFTLTRTPQDWVICLPILQKIRPKLSKVKRLMITQLVGGRAGIQAQLIGPP